MNLEAADDEESKMLKSGGGQGMKHAGLLACSGTFWLDNQCSTARSQQNVEPDGPGLVNGNMTGSTADLSRNALPAVRMAAGRDDRVLRDVFAHRALPQLTLSFHPSNKGQQPCPHLTIPAQHSEP